MDLGRGIIMLLASALAFWKGWQVHHGESATLAYILGVLALLMGLWHLWRRAAEPRR